MASKRREREREHELQLRTEFNSASQPLLVRRLVCLAASRALPAP
jgi:hypothetical protein